VVGALLASDGDAGMRYSKRAAQEVARTWCVTLLLAVFAVLVFSGPGLPAPGRVSVGDRALDFALTTGEGEFRLSQFAGGRPMVLAFTRAHW